MAAKKEHPYEGARTKGAQTMAGKKDDTYGGARPKNVQTMAEKKYGPCGDARPKGCKNIIPFGFNQPTTNQDLEAFQLVDEAGQCALVDRVPLRIGGHCMQDVENKGAFAGAQIGQVNLQVNVPYIEQKIGVDTGEQDKAGGMWKDFTRKAMNKKFEMSSGSKESERYQKLCRVSERHVRTTLYHEVLDKLDRTDSVTLLGNVGDGKTTLLHLICLEYSARGYLTIEIDRPEDIARFEIGDKPVLFVCDSMLGRILIDEARAQAWFNYERDTLLTSAKVKFLFACRIELWKLYEKSSSQNQMLKYTVDVRSYKLNDKDKTMMIDQHLGDKVSNYTKRLIAENSNFAFPACCSFVAQSQGDYFSNTRKLLETFSKPYHLVLKQLEAIEKNNKVRYATLVLCLLNERKLPKTGTSNVLTKRVCREIFTVLKQFYLSQGDETSSVEHMYQTLLNTAEDLDGWLFIQVDNYYDFYHDCIFEALCRVHGVWYPQHILTFCKRKSVFSVFTTKQVSDCERVTLSPSCYTKLVEIVTEECLKEVVEYTETWRFVFEEMNIPEILKEWSLLLKTKKSLIKKIYGRLFSRKEKEPKRLTDVLLLMAELPNSPLKKIDDAFVCAAYYGDLETSRSLSDFGVTTEGRGRGLVSAARRGHSNVVAMIVEWGGLYRRSVERALEGAVCYDRVECVREMMRLRPDVDPDTIHSLLQKAVECDSGSCVGELLKRETDTDTIHSLLEQAVRYSRALSVIQLLKQPIISRQTLQNMLDTADCDLFMSRTPQSVRDEIRILLGKHLNTVS